MDHRPFTGVSFRLRQACLLLLLFKASYIGLTCLALLLWPLGEGDYFRNHMLQWTPDKHVTFVSHFCGWDAEHYLNIAKLGYATGAARCAFYPLFPFLVAVLSLILAGHHILAGMLIANLFSLLGEMLFYIILVKRFGIRVAWLSLVLLITFPGSLFFQFIYSEGLFFFLLMLLVYGLNEDRMAICWIAAFLLPLTRAVGIFSIVPIFWHLFLKKHTFSLGYITNRIPVLKRYFNISTSQQIEQLNMNNRNLIIHHKFLLKRYSLLLAPLLGWAGYFFQMWLCTGNAFEGFAAQKLWGFESPGNIFKLGHFFSELLVPSNFHETHGSLLDRLSFLLMLYCIPLVWRLDKGWFLWAIMLGVVPAMTGVFVSYLRFSSVVFPLFVALGVYLSKPTLPYRILFWLCLTCFCILHVIILWRFVNFRWAG